VHFDGSGTSQTAARLRQRLGLARSGQSVRMLEYRRPDEPEFHWIPKRAEWIWEQRRACTDPDVPFSRARPLARSAYATVTLRAGTTGGAAKFELTVATADDDVEMLDEIDEPWNGPEELPDEFFRFGVRLADERATSNLPGATGMLTGTAP
jgi:hypothetical protein